MSLFRRMQIRIKAKACKDRYYARLKAEKVKKENKEESKT